MPVDLGNLRSAASRSRHYSTATNSQSARALGYKTAFLCHSHQDRTAVLGLLQVFREQGLHLYVDWMDSEMPATTNGDTARKIKNRIVEADLFLFLATPNSLASRWCPWEIGYADGVKRYESIFVIPTHERGVTYGNEYVDIYRRIDEANEGGLAAWYPRRYNDGVTARSL
ncbi:toll/interleukin-1 receptor domain-containing protein [Pseudomonas fitomaticsae]|uniref:TIR domain-containing protein n=1 Tax=Pseudomonas fitomaticsae TaxID=2837969 RepID=A0ABY3Q6D9_9PSED|nr:toll/interleukin-1 receptor domain-containing protein [Pseudomonas fitomaticsae]UFQ01702.1 TIR domain-containing protein [Pseudomonas fitomaticsae]